MGSLAHSLEAKVKGLDRVKRQASTGWAGLTAPNYVRTPIIHCKKCGCTITDGKTLASFSELKLTFNDNSAHVTTSCKKCVVGLSLAELEAIYCADLLALSQEEEACGRLMHWQLLSDRKITGYERL